MPVLTKKYCYYILIMNRVGRPRTIDRDIEDYDGELIAVGRVLECTVCNVKVRRDLDAIDRHVNSQAHITMKRLMTAKPR